MSQQAQAVVQPQRKAPTVSSLKGGILQRKCECGQHTLAGGECESCRKKREETLLKGAPSGNASTLQRAAVNSTPAPVGAVPPAVHTVLGSPGRPLDRSTRSLMESRFGHDFSQVRVHNDPQAAESASAVHARAYTVGEQMVFGAGQYAPDTPAGKHLLAHELTHTIQQHGMQRYASDGPLSISTHDGALEHEAEMAASAVTGTGQGMDAAARVSHRPLTPVVSRAAISSQETKERDWEDLPDSVVVRPGQKALRRAVRAPETIAFDIDVFKVPGTKGAQDAFDLYKARADAAALEATVNMSKKSPSAGLWQARAKTEDLRKAWLLKVGWSDKDPQVIDDLWAKAGGDPKVGKSGGFPIANNETCQMDHIIELQLGGVNVPNNVQMLAPKENRESGLEIWREVSEIAQTLRARFDPDVKEIVLHFREAQPSGTPLPCSPKGTCTAVECDVKDVVAAREGGTEKAVKAGLKPYVIEAIGLEAKLQAPEVADKSISTQLHESDIPENAAGSELISGIILETLHQPGTGAGKGKGKDKSTDTIDAFIESKTHFKRKRTRVPLEIKDETKPLHFDVKKDSEIGHLSLRDKSRVSFTYPYLSEGYLIPKYDEASGFSAEGKLKPSVPFLSSSELTVHLEEEAFTATISKQPTTFPIPNSRITKAEIGIELAPQFGAKGEVALEVGPKGKPILDGLVTAGADESGFVAKGTLNAHLPGIDEAKGEVMYRNGELTGGVDVNFGQTKLKFVKGGLVHIGFVGKDVNATGQVIILMPRGKEATLTVERGRAGNWLYRGEGELDIPVPGLKPVNIKIDYDGEHLNAGGDVDIIIKGLKGHLHVGYRSDRTSGDAKISGKGELVIDRGRAKGGIKVNLSDQYKLSGEGMIQYQLSENLVGTIGVILHEDQSVGVKGQLEFPKPIQLFRGFSNEYELFDYSMDIPILAIPIGLRSIGLIGRISGGMKINYGIGPGELRNVHVMATFNPLEEQKDLELEAGAILVIPAHAGVSLFIRGAVGVSVVIASATGGITATGTAELRGGFQAPVSIHYIRGKFGLDAKPTILAELVLILGLDADVTAELGIGALKYKAQKVWNLAAYEWGSGLQFGLTAPIHYATDEEFHMPSASDIVWIKPNIDLKTLVPRLAKQAAGKEAQE